MGTVAPQARAVEASLSQEYSRLADERLESRRADPLLRAMDVLGASALLLALAPVLLAVAAAVRATSSGPAFYRGLRVGRAGRVFTMLKFRTLTEDAEARLGPYLGLELSQLTQGEVTLVGRWLRRTHIDEVPQLFNVVKGDMSLVGPRPIRPLFFEELCHDIPQYWQRLVIRPGMTGLAQLRLDRDASWSEKLAHDLEYIADRSVALYIRILVATAWRVALEYRAPGTTAGAGR